ncbi:DUF4426 domain-containing protein [Pseudomonas sp. 10B1]|uniref:DUF4426 domain-containing protein n=1 Tax=unclassified Pseudomonas TaxID=196821 RepID=UPI002AB3FF6A|nr:MULTISPECIES: DUF4426 domain-containing protein [unclassified Pseudomonas]MDY7562794.1 DUF4426 domain-containing protein [Pseudomonas sp. AB6]MEA9979861.1 DUF4426 domain-containing protein [Pseudomonas sp. RTS4]MEA9994407.1 DUF4426 domain-containing protein [Pseudomonas sp. AA4]MEB0087825.1 DUF4426 domain-containing protein [Pseudomonas sp. RTI1]MEB0126661.1 DUF4426 domain-containing protein [Pseudomonas sp. CCC1.2]
MRRLALFICAICLALPAIAADYAKPERKEVFGDTTLHYSAITSSYLQPDVAAAAGLIRSKNQGVLNIAAVKGGKTVVANITGTVKDLTGRNLTLTFKQLAENDAVYYIAQFPIEQQETLTFSINVKAGEDTHSFSFDQELFPGE